MTDRQTKPISKEQAREIFNRAFLDGSVIYTKHCQERMEERNIDANDLMALARAGLVYKNPERDVKTGEWKFTIEHPSSHFKTVYTVLANKKIRLLTVIDGS